MPYIKQEDREQYEKFLKEVEPIKTKGDLEFCIFKLMKIYMYNHDYRYSDLHDCVYAAQHCADEFRRLYLDKREDQARETNGDIE
jgi:hypothetical protein